MKFILLIFFLSFTEKNLELNRMERGRITFSTNCLACHNGGNNLIIPEKNLKKEALEANGMNTIAAISYQVINGKNGMPAFGGRLTEDEVEAVSFYVMDQSLKNFQ